MASAAFALALVVSLPAHAPACAQSLEAQAGDPATTADAPEAPVIDPPPFVEAPSGTTLLEAHADDSGTTADTAEAPVIDPPPFVEATSGTTLLEAQADDSGTAADTAEAPVVDPPPFVEAPSGAAAQIAEWVVATGDNGGRPFMIVDKVAADVFVFGADGRLQGEAPVLVGLARGDDSAPGIGDLALSAIRPDERTTPAGRFVTEFGPASGNRTVLWVDYADSISLHPVITTNPQEHRLERIRSPAPEDHRISYGCINVPSRFYTDVVLPALAGGRGVVYILPDTKPLEEVFPGFAVAGGTSGGSGADESQGLEGAGSSEGPSDANATFDNDSRTSASVPDPMSDKSADTAQAAAVDVGATTNATDGEPASSAKTMDASDSAPSSAAPTDAAPAASNGPCLEVSESWLRSPTRQPPRVLYPTRCQGRALTQSGRSDEHSSRSLATSATGTSAPRLAERRPPRRRLKGPA